MHRNQVTFATDPDGKQIVGVTLSNRPVTAWLYVEDYARVLKLYPSSAWSLTGDSKGHTYVRVRGAGKSQPSIYIARLIAGDHERTAVQFKDGNSLNLRRNNLFHAPGGGKRRKTLRGRAALRIVTEAARV
jgi:hypothetical protein